MKRRTRPTPPAAPARRALPHPFGLEGPMSLQVTRTLAQRNADKASAAIAQLGERYVFHPSQVMR